MKYEGGHKWQSPTLADHLLYNKSSHTTITTGNYIYELRRDDTFDAKIQENETFVLFLCCHSMDITDRPNKVYTDFLGL